MSIDPVRIEDRLIVALDVANAWDARGLVLSLGPTVTFYKIGLELLFSGGLDLANELKGLGKRVFLDMKLLDIANTVERAVATATDLGVDFLTLHGHDTKTLEAAVRGRGDNPTKLLAVTVLTSLAKTDLEEQGTALDPHDLVLRRAKIAKAAGIDGVIASGQEAGAVRQATGSDFLIVTPGIRLAGGDTGGQQRITTPFDAIAASANHIVVGRPITRAADPKHAAETFQRLIAEASSKV